MKWYLCMLVVTYTHVCHRAHFLWHNWCNWKRIIFYEQISIVTIGGKISVFYLIVNTIIQKWISCQTVQINFTVFKCCFEFNCNTLCNLISDVHFYIWYTNNVPKWCDAVMSVRLIFHIINSPLFAADTDVSLLHRNTIIRTDFTFWTNMNCAHYAVYTSLFLVSILIYLIQKI